MNFNIFKGFAKVRDVLSTLGQDTMKLASKIAKPAVVGLGMMALLGGISEDAQAQTGKPKQETRPKDAVDVKDDNGKVIGYRYTRVTIEGGKKITKNYYHTYKKDVKESSKETAVPVTAKAQAKVAVAAPIVVEKVTPRKVDVPTVGSQFSAEEKKKNAEIYKNASPEKRAKLDAQHLKKVREQNALRAAEKRKAIEEAKAKEDAARRAAEAAAAAAASAQATDSATVVAVSKEKEKETNIEAVTNIETIIETQAPAKEKPPILWDIDVGVRNIIPNGDYMSGSPAPFINTELQIPLVPTKDGKDAIVYVVPGVRVLKQPAYQVISDNKKCSTCKITYNKNQTTADALQVEATLALKAVKKFVFNNVPKYEKGSVGAELSVTSGGMYRFGSAMTKMNDLAEQTGTQPFRQEDEDVRSKVVAFLRVAAEATYNIGKNAQLYVRGDLMGITAKPVHKSARTSQAMLDANPLAQEFPYTGRELAEDARGKPFNYSQIAGGLRLFIR